MHKCIMVKVGEKRNTHKVCKKQRNFWKTGGSFPKYREIIINFREIGGIRNRLSEILADENVKYLREKVKF